MGLMVSFSGEGTNRFFSVMTAIFRYW